MVQQYVSDELTHFVGASLRPDERAQYSLFSDIVRAGLLYNPSFGGGFGYGLSPVANDLGESLSAPVVCFCDIPVGDLEVHTGKYGKFGIAFRKKFLIAQGANPVFYVVKNAASQPVFDHMFAFDRPSSERGEIRQARPRRMVRNPYSGCSNSGNTRSRVCWRTEVHQQARP